MFIMKQTLSMLLLAGMVVVLAACGGKKKSNDIIAPRIVKVQPKEPIRMQPYLDERKVEWIGKTYFVTIGRQPSDSLPMVKDETGQKYVDNVFSLKVSRKDGSVFYTRTFTKKALTQYLDDDFNKTGVFEGLVFDKAEGDYLFTNENGRELTTNQINMQLKRVLEKYDILDPNQHGKVTCHSLRHTYVTRMIESGMPPKVLANLIGHRDIRVTLNTYCDAFEQFQTENIIQGAEYLNKKGLSLNNKKDGSKAVENNVKIG